MHVYSTPLGFFCVPLSILVSVCSLSLSLPFFLPLLEQFEQFEQSVLSVGDYTVHDNVRDT